MNVEGLSETCSETLRPESSEHVVRERRKWLKCKGLVNLLKLKEDLQDPDEERGTTLKNDQNKFYSSSDFRNAYNLVGHEDSISDEMWLLRGLVAVFLFKCLKETSFFNTSQTKGLIDAENASGNDDLTANELFIGKLLFRLLNILPHNCHDISEFETPVLDVFTPGCNKVSVGKLSMNATF